MNTGSRSNVFIEFVERKEKHMRGDQLPTSPQIEKPTNEKLGGFFVGGSRLLGTYFTDKDSPQFVAVYLFAEGD